MTFVNGYRMILISSRYIMSASEWPSGLRRQTQGSYLTSQTEGLVFWSSIEGVGSNPTSDKLFQLHDLSVYPILLTNLQRKSGDGGIMVSIVAFQAIDPSSILGHRNHLVITVVVGGISWNSHWIFC